MSNTYALCIAQQANVGMVLGVISGDIGPIGRGPSLIPQVGLGYGMRSKVSAMFRADFRQILDESCRLKGNWRAADCWKPRLLSELGVV